MDFGRKKVTCPWLGGGNPWHFSYAWTTVSIICIINDWPCKLRLTRAFNNIWRAMSFLSLD